MLKTIGRSVENPLRGKSAEEFQTAAFLEKLKSVFL